MHARAIKTGLPGFGLIYLRFIGTDINGVFRRLHKSWNPEKKSMASNRTKISPRYHHRISFFKTKLTHYVNTMYYENTELFKIIRLIENKIFNIHILISDYESLFETRIQSLIVFALVRFVQVDLLFRLLRP